MAKSFRLFAVLFLAALAAAPARALNWEGHDGFFHEALPVPDFTDGVAPPKVKPLPLCEELEKAHATNSYAQIPLPGVNCRKAIPEGPS
ncbi:MAG: hypothetical protein U1E15_13455 [Hyphomicrobiales bacterium]